MNSYDFGPDISVKFSDGRWMCIRPANVTYCDTLDEALACARSAAEAAARRAAEAKSLSDYLDSDEAKREAAEWDNLPEWGDVPELDNEQ
jgi:hypothetical protein